ncbi:MAG TPA: pyruvate dehydrogenase (acetyl-transferring) E1 component subunit alpha [Meiothermus sp.]|nr:pyruvate dehydrogenase (acetyl-transferring) E1 component subunit alpha [Meiothermus sp.]
MDTVRYLQDDGTPLGELPFSAEELLSGYRALRRARHFDERALVLQRQGKLGVYPPFRGQEAAQVGVALALEKTDWLVPSYRETAAVLTHGLPLASTILYWRADPGGWRFPEGVRILPFYIPIATQIPQAVGVAQAGKYYGENWVAAAFIGDGGTSEGDFHEGLNFASVFGAPVLFVVQNNGWAISVPTEKQMKVRSVASRAQGYGIPGVVVDGNDLVAVWKAARDAVERARRGEGPTLLEALTYRIAPHTSSDDPGRYRTEEQTELWKRKDPVMRTRRCLEHLGVWDEEREKALVDELEAELLAAVEEADRSPQPEPWSIVEEVFAEMNADQKAAWDYLQGGTR